MFTSFIIIGAMKSPIEFFAFSNLIVKKPLNDQQRFWIYHYYGYYTGIQVLQDKEEVVFGDAMMLYQVSLGPTHNPSKPLI